MSHTTVDSKVAVAGGAMYVDGNEQSLVIPPKDTIYVNIPGYVKSNGDIEIPVGDAVVNENNGKAEMQTSDGRKLNLPKEVVANLWRASEERAKKREKALAKSKIRPSER